MIGFIAMVRLRLRCAPEWRPYPREHIAKAHPGFYPFTRAYYRLLDAATAAGLRMGPP